MSYRLRPGLSLCEADGRMIALDSAADRYFQLGRELADCLRSVMSPGEAPAADVAKLVEHGLLVEAPGGFSVDVAIFTWPEAQRSASEAARALHLVRPTDLIAVSLALLRAWASLKTRSFTQVMERLARRKRRLAVLGSVEDGDDWAARFAACRRVLPLRAICLRDSLAFLDFLAGKGFCADLVIGVEVAPFSAHCWVQAADSVLNDTLLRVRRHTPILAI